jgi:uncharacterized protein YdaT
MKKKNKKWYIIFGSILLTLLGVLEGLTGFLNNSFQIFDRIKSDKVIEITVDSIKNTPSENNNVIIKSSKQTNSVIRICDLVKEATDYKNRGFDAKANSIYWNAYKQLTDTLKDYNFEVELRNKSIEVQNNLLESFFSTLNIK